MDFEKLGSFYLGKEYDIEKGSLLDRLVMYDARDLTTHAVCVGMTGSGKTGLCIDLLEEAAIDRVPAIIVDPKGDMTNLLLTFPDLQPQDFRAWINIDDARRKGLSADEFAEQQASTWRQGLAQWGQDPGRISLLKDSVEPVIYTPGSSAGTPVSILSGFAAPSLEWNTHTEELREKIQGTVSGLLGLIGVDADPVRSRESILLASLFEDFWRRKEDLDLARLILAIQNPPISKLGVFDVETFFPSKERFELAMRLNSILASPSFSEWIEGHPLNVADFLAGPSGKPRHSIFYIAHLSESERMFFVTLLLNEILSWMRTQPGTTSLRAILYMDEIFGYFPPVANPPSKRPMMTLLKQARAFGLGVVLATQNPIDLDYKGLTNTGTWFIGRLQTERDKMRVLDGLEGVAGVGGPSWKKNELSRIISDLGSRVFLLHNIHEEKPVIFQTRWAMSYLRGPLTKTQIRETPGVLEPPIASSSEPVSIPTSVSENAVESSLSGVPPVLPRELQSVYLPVEVRGESALRQVLERWGGQGSELRKELVYHPALLGLANVHFVDRRAGVNTSRQVTRLLEMRGEPGFVRWEDSVDISCKPSDLLRESEVGAKFVNLPQSIDEVQEIKALEKDLGDFLYHTTQIRLLFNPSTGLLSQPDELDRDFRMKVSLAAREKRDAEVDALNRRYEKQLQRLRDRLDKAELAHSKREVAASARKTEALVSIGESILGMFLGRRTTRAASSGLSKYRMSSGARMAAAEAEQKVEVIRNEITVLEEELRREATSISSRWDEAVEVAEEQSVKPRRTDVAVTFVGIAWVPHWEIQIMDRAGQMRIETVSASST